MDDLMYRHWDTWKDNTYSHVCLAAYEDGKIAGAIQDIMPDEKFDCPLKPFGGPEDIVWSPDGISILYVCKKYSGKDYAQNTDSDIYWYDIPSGITTNITDSLQGYDLSPAFSPDGTKIAWLNMPTPGYESDQREIKLFEVKTGQSITLTGAFDHDISVLSWGKDNRSIYFIASVNGTEQVFAVNLGSTTFSKINAGGTLINQVSNGIQDVMGVIVVDSEILAPVMSMSSPVELYLISVKNGNQRQITQINEPLWSGIKKGKVESRMVRTSDNKEMLTWVIYPPDFDPSQKYPCLLYCQGGPHSEVSQFFSYRWNFQLMAANGYIIVAPNRRGLPGFGADWNNEIAGDWGGQTIRDYLSAIDQVSSESYVDKKGLGAVGASFGGYSAYYLAGHHENRFSTFIAHDGVFNLESMYGSTEELFFPNWEMGGPYWMSPAPESYALFSPHKWVQNWNTPMLVIHGGKDYRVPDTQAMEAFTALQVKNIPSRFLYFPDENHWILSPQNGILWQRVFFDWLDRWLKN
jgi:dipeptidyl aminopeptidase/acylaminoacyl peptidase